MRQPSAQTLVQLLLLTGLFAGLVPRARPRRVQVPAPEPPPRSVAGPPKRTSVHSFLGSLLGTPVPWLVGPGSGPTAPRALLRWLGDHPAAAFAACAAILVVGPVGLAVLALVPLAGRWREMRRVRSHEQRYVDELPDVVDLLRLAVASGCTIHLAVEAVVRHVSGAVADQLSSALERVARGARLADALASVRSDVPVLAPVLDALIAAERYGTPLVPVLERLADDARGSRRRRAEAAARRVPVQLLFPLILCILPSIGFLTVVPVASSALEGLDLGPAPPTTSSWDPRPPRRSVDPQPNVITSHQEDMR